MISIARPELKISDKDKLHVSRRPGTTAWLLLFLSAVFFIVIFSYLTSNVYFLVILLLGEIMFALDSFGEWEDLTLYSQENKAILEKCIWSDKLYAGRSEFSTLRLTDIQHVGVSGEMGLFLLHKNGKIFTLSTKGLTREETQGLRKEINYFLNMNRIKHLERSPIDPSDRLLLASDSEDECLQKLPTAYLTASNELTVSDNALGANKMRCYRTQQNLSFPSLPRRMQFSSCQAVNLRKSPYTENSKRLDRIKYTRNICVVPTSRN